MTKYRKKDKYDFLKIDKSNMLKKVKIEFTIQ